MKENKDFTNVTSSVVSNSFCAWHGLEIFRRNNKNNDNNILMSDLGMSDIFCFNFVIFHTPFRYSKLEIFWGYFAMGKNLKFQTIFYCFPKDAQLNILNKCWNLHYNEHENAPICLVFIKHHQGAWQFYFTKVIIIKIINLNKCFKDISAMWLHITRISSSIWCVYSALCIVRLTHSAQCTVHCKTHSLRTVHCSHTRYYWI